MGKVTALRLAKLLECATFLAFMSSGPSCLSAQSQGSDRILTRVAEAQLGSLASRVGEKIKKQSQDANPATVLVFDFTATPSETSSRLGTLLADRFSEMLNVTGAGIRVIDRKVLKDYFKDTYTTIEDLHSSILVCLEIAKEMGATRIVRANLVEDADRQLKVLLQIAGDGPSLFDEAQFFITKDMEDILSKPDLSFSKASDTIPPEHSVLVLGPNGVDGVSWPTCITCPDAQYTEAARAVKFKGTVELSAVITASGDARAIYVVKPLPLGLTQRAIATIKDWKFKPAIKDGKPIAVRVPITMTFRLL